MTRRASALLPLLLAAACGRAPVPAPAIVVTAGGDEMVALPGGTFTMGSTGGDADERPPHRVTLGPFLIDRREVAQALLQRLEQTNPSRTKAADHPIDNVTWVMAAELCNARSRAEGLEPCYDAETARCDFGKNGYRLPTEAEWEYACRAGTDTEWSCGGDPGRLRDHAWFADNAGGRTHAVGTRRPNAWGLFDMHGNVAEWCNDVYGAATYARGDATDPRGPDDDGDAAVQYAVRGGSYVSSAAALRSAARGRDRPGFGDACLAPDTLGFRCVRAVPKAAGD
ncbi:MAG: formylglycine-generating enzyme family protein [Planctomycetota bacterium]